MANDGITLSRQEAIDTLGTLDAAIEALADTDLLAMVVELEDAAAILTERLFPDL